MSEITEISFSMIEADMEHVSEAGRGLWGLSMQWVTLLGQLTDAGWILMILCVFIRDAGWALPAGHTDEAEEGQAGW